MAATESARRQALADLARSRRAAGSEGRTFRNAAVAIALLGLVGLLGLWLWGSWAIPPEILAVRTSVDEQIAQLQEVSRSGQSFSSDTGSLETVFAAIRQLPDGYREQAREELGRLLEARETAEVDSFFSLPPEQRATELDRRIKAEEDRRQKREAERSRRLAERGDANSARPAARPQAGGGGGQPGGGRTEESRNLRSKQRLDKTSAESRARRTEYRRAKDQRRIQLGFAPGR